MSILDATLSTVPPRAVIPVVPPDLLAWRKATGAERWDEVWDGVIHMPPAPNRAHQDFEFHLEQWLRRHWAQPIGAKVYHQVQVSPADEWWTNYRIPDLVLLTPARFAIDRNEYFHGAPDVVVEIHSPGDESFEKLPFYADLGVPEVWIIERYSKQPQTHALQSGVYHRIATDADGWLRSPATGVEMRVVTELKLTLRLAGDGMTALEIPSP